MISTCSPTWCPAALLCAAVAASLASAPRARERCDASSHRIQVANFSARMLLGEPATGASLDISELCASVQRAVASGGAQCAIDALDGAALIDAMRLVLPPLQVTNVDSFIRERYLYPSYAPGAEFWARHWVGGMLYEQLWTMEPLSRTISWLREQQRSGGSFAAISVMHGVMWTALAHRYATMPSFPMEAVQWCGRPGSMDYAPRLGTNLVKECVHGIGHSIFYGMLELDSSVQYSTCSAIRPGGYTLPPRLLRTGREICQSAPSLEWARYCIGGLHHSFTIYKTVA